VALLHAEGSHPVFACLLDLLASFPKALSHFRPKARLRHDSTIAISNCAPEESIVRGNVAHSMFHSSPDCRHFASAYPRSKQVDRPATFGHGHRIGPSLVQPQAANPYPIIGRPGQLHIPVSEGVQVLRAQVVPDETHNDRGQKQKAKGIKRDDFLEGAQSSMTVPVVSCPGGNSFRSLL
jgi:hypothetical protein